MRGAIAAIEMREAIRFGQMIALVCEIDHCVFGVGRVDTLLVLGLGRLGRETDPYVE